ncbi:hypothetical protein ACLOJK_007062 [Asimina triloba]
MILADDVASLRLRYHIPNNVELSAPREGETLPDHHDDNISLNKWTFKVRVQIPFDFGVSELLHAFDAAPIQFCKWRKCRADHRFWASLLSRKVMLGCVTFARKRNTKIILNFSYSVLEWKLRFFYAHFEEAQGTVRSWGVLLQWNDELPKVRSVVSKELKWGQRAVLEFFQPHNLKWHSTKGAFFRWCQGLFLSGVPAASPRGEPEGCLYGEVSGSSADARPSIGGSTTLVPRRPDHQTRVDERSKKKKRLVQVRFEGQGPTALGEECLAGQKEVDLQDGLALSREEACRSGLIDTEVRTIEEQGLLSYCGANPGEAGALVRCGVLRSIFGEVSACPTDDQLFRQPFDMEARALKILGDLLAVQSRAIRECHAPGFAPSLDEEGRGAD